MMDDFKPTYATTVVNLIKFDSLALYRGDVAM